jgi:hypothetical protein
MAGDKLLLLQVTPTPKRVQLLKLSDMAEDVCFSWHRLRDHAC